MCPLRWGQRTLHRELNQTAVLWSARTCPRFESGDMSPHSKKGWLEGQPRVLPQRLIEVLDQIVCVFKTDGQTQQTFG